MCVFRSVIRIKLPAKKKNLKCVSGYSPDGTYAEDRFACIVPCSL